MIKIFCLMAALTASAWAQVFSQDENKAYENRRFIYLEHLLVLDQKSVLIPQIHDQERDLVGCREIHHGKGGLLEAAQCISFLNRETKLGMRGPLSKSLVKDINILCSRLADNPHSLKKLLNPHFLGGGHGRWGPCIRETWRQVYLTAYARFEADPVDVLALVRRAQGVLPPDKVWSPKIKALLMVP